MSRHSLAAISLALTLAVLAAPAFAAGSGARPDLGTATASAAVTPVQYYYPPPGCYAPAPPPPVYYPPPTQQRDLNRAYDPTIDGPLGYPTRRGAPPPVPYSAMCYAGAYTCQLPVAGPVGSGCSCPGLGAPSYGQIR